MKKLGGNLLSGIGEDGGQGVNVLLHAELLRRILLKQSGAGSDPFVAILENPDILVLVKTRATIRGSPCEFRTRTPGLLPAYLFGIYRAMRAARGVSLPRPRVFA
jgi:hypothetical protein